MVSFAILYYDHCLHIFVLDLVYIGSSHTRIVPGGNNWINSCAVRVSVSAFTAPKSIFPFFAAVQISLFCFGDSFHQSLLPSNTLATVSDIGNVDMAGNQYRELPWVNLLSEINSELTFSKLN